MSEPQARTIALGSGADARDIAILERGGREPGLFWLGGYKSDMGGTKAEALDRFAGERGLAMTRFDYSGHGRSGGSFADGTISRWLEEALAVFDRTSGRQIVIGSSMGGWLALLLAEARRATGGKDGRIAGLVLIAPALDMTKLLMWDKMSKKVRKELLAAGVYRTPSDYSAEPYVITKKLIEDGERHLFGDRLIETGCPVHILQGVRDADVPWRLAEGLVTQARQRRRRADAGQGRRPPPVAAGGHRAPLRRGRRV